MPSNNRNKPEDKSQQCLPDFTIPFQSSDEIYSQGIYPHHESNISISYQPYPYPINKESDYLINTSLHSAPNINEHQDEILSSQPNSEKDIQITSKLKSSAEEFSYDGSLYLSKSSTNLHHNNPLPMRRTHSLETSIHKKKKKKLIMDNNLFSNIISISSLDIKHDPPVYGCELKPIVHLKYDNGNINSAGIDDCEYRWYRSMKRLCSKCKSPGLLECLVCAKLECIKPEESYFCSTKCMISIWDKHRECHGNIEYDLNKWNDDDVDNMYFSKKNNDLYCKFPGPIKNEWEFITDSRLYTPNDNDIGRMLLLECRPKRREKKEYDWICRETHPVLQRPKIAPERNMIWLSDDKFPNDRCFSVLSYNCLAPLYTTSTMYPYVPSYILAWDYRKYNIKREVLRYKPDIICLQEVQQNHFEEYFQIEFQKNGYEGIFRQKSRDPNKKEIDGCAIFFKSNRFQVANRFHIDFNDTSSLYLKHHQRKHNDIAIAKGKAKINPNQLKKMVKRLTKGNIALILVLEEKQNYTMSHSAPPKRVCIANTHVHWDPAFTDVKLWQSFILCQEISKLVLQRNLPLILCGDFNSVPTSAVYKLLTTKTVDKKSYDELFVKYNGLCIIPSQSELTHTLNLKSAYKKEPLFTNYTRSYKGTLDYVLYSYNSLKCLGYLQEYSEKELSKEIALPNSQHSSDHIPLLSYFTFKDEWDKFYAQSKIKSQYNTLNNNSNKQGSINNNNPYIINNTHVMRTNKSNDIQEDKNKINENQSETSGKADRYYQHRDMYPSPSPPRLYENSFQPRYSRYMDQNYNMNRNFEYNNSRGTRYKIKHNPYSNRYMNEKYVKKKNDNDKDLIDSDDSKLMESSPYKKNNIKIIDENDEKALS